LHFVTAEALNINISALPSK
jgi:hypothetical protein